MTKGLNTIASEAGELKATISQLATALTNNEQAHTRLSADMEAAQTKLKALQEASVAAFDELAAIAERREPEAAETQDQRNEREQNWMLQANPHAQAVLGPASGRLNSEASF